MKSVWVVEQRLKGSAWEPMSNVCFTKRKNAEAEARILRSIGEPFDIKFHVRRYVREEKT